MGFSPEAFGKLTLRQMENYLRKSRKEGGPELFPEVALAEHQASVEKTKAVRSNIIESLKLSGKL